MTTPFPDSLCHRCTHLRRVESGRGSVFLMCREPSLPKYPRQPVAACDRLVVMPTRDELVTELLKLPTADRAAIATLLLESLEPPAAEPAAAEPPAPARRRRVRDTF